MPHAARKAKPTRATLAARSAALITTTQIMHTQLDAHNTHILAITSLAINLVHAKPVP